MKNQKTIVMGALLLGATALTPAAYGQDAAAEGDQVKSVYDRARPDYDAPGVRTGSFLFYPKATVEAAYKSNIYAEESNVTDDFIVSVKPSFNLVSDWNSSFFALEAKADVGRYLDNGSENFEDYSVGMNGRKDISYGTDIHANASYNRGHEDRGAADSPGAAAEQVFFDVLTAGIGFKRDVSVLSFAVDGEYTNRNFQDSERVGGGPAINNDDRDRERFKGIVRVGYELSDGYEAFVRLTADRIKYDDSTEDGGPNRNSDGYEVVGGAAFDLTGKAKGEFYGGYMKRSYDSATLDTTDGVKFGAALLWNATGLTSFRASVDRSIEESTLSEQIGGSEVFASGYVSTAISLRAEHELRRNVLLMAEGGYTKMDYQRITREDDVLKGRVGFKYLVGRNMNVNAGYNLDYRNSSIQGQDYTRHSFMVGLTGQW
ncbi:outer membrane beta-barrel protein [Kordiimonas gwangyangensis]|uniref:outer membrane beta-barrel protein n=1 Tax=Kordiimonas gwangyangensis TaxID=288022 RepID=UPI00037636B6|nr:outer membrane beta-barrel protein [Kordiimonas gwangyangensis]